MPMNLRYLLFLSSNKHQPSFSAACLNYYTHFGQLVRTVCLYWDTLFITSFTSLCTLWMAYGTAHDNACCFSQTCDLWFPVGSFQTPTERWIHDLFIVFSFGQPLAVFWLPKRVLPAVNITPHGANLLHVQMIFQCFSVFAWWDYIYWWSLCRGCAGQHG